jgi:hypothetical protein
MTPSKSPIRSSLDKIKSISQRLVLCLSIFSFLGWPSITPAPDVLAKQAQATEASYEWSTFFGNGGGWDDPADVLSDGAGNVYLLGLSSSPWDGPGGQSPKHAHNRQHTNLVVIKLTNGVYQWHTFYGSTDVRKSATATELAFDPQGNLLVLGTSGEWAGPGGQAPIHPFENADFSSEQVVLKLTPDGDYLWHTFYPAVHSGGIAVDGYGAVFVLGSNSLWVSSPGYIPLHGSELDGVNLQIIKLDNAGQYLWHTYYGAGILGNWGYGIDAATDAGGDLYVIGTSPGSWLGDNATPPMHNYAGGVIWWH